MYYIYLTKTNYYKNMLEFLT